MRVLVAAASFSSELSGVQRHAFNLARCLLGHADVSAVDLVVAPWQEELAKKSGLLSNARLKLHRAEMKPSAISRNLWYYRQLPSLASKLKADIVHLAYPVPVDGRAFGCPTIVTLHDLYPYEIPSNFGFPKAFFNQAILRQCLGQVDSIACVSESTRQLLARYLPKRLQENTTQICNSVEPEAACSDLSPIQGWSEDSFLLCVAQHRRNKNIPFLLRVFDRLRRSGQIDMSMQLVILGIQGPETRRIHGFLSETGLAQSVLLMEGLSEPELQWCYSNCSAVLAPSTTEGFGLPVVEGLLAGCRVVCSDIPAFREIGSGHCHFVRMDEHAEVSFAQAIGTCLQSQPGNPVPFPQLSFSRIANQYTQLYRSLLIARQGMRRLHSAAYVPAIDTERQSL